MPGHQLDQVLQLHDPALAGLEGLAVLPVHGPEAVVFQARRRRGDTRLVGSLEDLFEVLLLAVVDHVEDAVRTELLHALVDSGQVGRAVEHRAVGFLQHQRRDLLPVAGLADLHDQGAPAFPGVPFLFQARDQAMDPVLGIAFPEPEVEADVQLLVALPEVIDGHVAEVLPQGAVARPAVLEVHGGLARRFGERGIPLLPFGGFRVDVLQVGDVHRGIFGIGAGKRFVEIRKVRPGLRERRDDESHLQSPVAQVHVADHLVAHEAADPHDALADDRRA